MARKQWVYRPTEEEHELLMKFMAENPEFNSIAQVVREGALRLIHSNDKRRLFTEVAELIDSLKEQRERFMELVLKYSEE